MKQFQILYKNDENFFEKLREIKQWRTSNSGYVTIFRIYSEDMEFEHIQHICDCLDDEMPDALYLGCTTHATIIDMFMMEFCNEMSILREDIQALSNVLRKTTIGIHSCSIGRWGGEEFMVLLSDSNADDAVVLAEKIRLKFASVSYEIASGQTVSIGVAQAKDETADALYNRVDKALYMAKAAGKNQVVRLD